jgi:mono/diheme cytochrome c family protein
MRTRPELVTALAPLSGASRREAVRRRCGESSQAPAMARLLHPSGAVTVRGGSRRLPVVILLALLAPAVAAAFATSSQAAGPEAPGGAPDRARGAALYAEQCASCHGTEGRGDGPAAYLLHPKPRDLTAARYRLVSTWEGVPTDDDLFRTITRGMPGSAMPSWRHLPERDRWALVAHVKSLATTPLEVAPASPPAAEDVPGTGVLAVPPEPADSETNVARARELYAGACASCHGTSGRGDVEQELFDAEGRPTHPRDHTSGVFKGDPRPEHLYRRIVLGMPGTPMPNNDWALGDDAWYLVRYVLSLSSPVQRDRAEMRRFRIRAPRVARVPINPDDGLWREAAPARLHLMPLWWRYERPEEVTVHALHDGRELALLLVWADDTDDHTAIRPQDFRDAVAVQFALEGEPPFFAMGTVASPVNIWMWKAERQADLEPGFQDLETVYPHLGIDSYPDPLRDPLEQPLRHALTLQSSPLFVTAWGAGNIVADPTRRAAAEDLRAEGFGTLRARPRPDQAVEAHGVWSTGSYRVVLRRGLKARGPDAARLRPGRTLPVAFAVWNGAAGDRNGKKSVTIWQELQLAP